MYCPNCGNQNGAESDFYNSFQLPHRLNCEKCSLMFTVEVKKPVTLKVIADLYASGERIKAIKAVREETKLGLREAKQLTEMIHCTLNGVKYEFSF